MNNRFNIAEMLQSKIYKINYKEKKTEKKNVYNWPVGQY